MVVLGIDPGFATIGYGIVKKKGSIYMPIDYGVIKTSPKTSAPQRFKQIYDSLEELIKKYKPDAIAIEELFFNRNAKSLINVAQSRGVSILAAIIYCGNIYEYTPLQIKQGLTGYGRAEKHQVQYMLKNLLGISDIPKPDDAADALAVAITHLQTNQVLSGTKI